MNQGPIQEFRVGGIKAAVWENENDKGKYFTVTFVRSYRDSHGDWRETNILMPDHLPRLALVINKAYDFIMMSPRLRPGPSNDNHANDNAPPQEETAQVQEEIPDQNAEGSFSQKIEKRGNGRKR
ncbi:MAG: hypothetical protein ABIS50_03715 [Luteolibacter sp.]|uniref:hypothetical protein n=1 Tax=Luteolibacter sp. TaxID=1962973 RepID=UPI00326414E4